MLDIEHISRAHVWRKTKTISTVVNLLEDLKWTDLSRFDLIERTRLKTIFSYNPPYQIANFEINVTSAAALYVVVEDSKLA